MLPRPRSANCVWSCPTHMQTAPPHQRKTLAEPCVILQNYLSDSQGDEEAIFARRNILSSLFRSHSYQNIVSQESIHWRFHGTTVVLLTHQYGAVTAAHASAHLQSSSHHSLCHTSFAWVCNRQRMRRRVKFWQVVVEWKTSNKHALCDWRGPRLNHTSLAKHTQMSTGK